MISLNSAGQVFMQGGGNIYLWSRDLTLYDRRETKFDAWERKFLSRIARSLKPMHVALSNFHIMSRKTSMQLKDMVLQHIVAFGVI